jgi:hypothetical protein
MGVVPYSNNCYSVQVFWSLVLCWSPPKESIANSGKNRRSDWLDASIPSSRGAVSATSMGITAEKVAVIMARPVSAELGRDPSYESCDIQQRTSPPPESAEIGPRIDLVEEPAPWLG